jgi:7-carboxy-7-deazaguanine synthase
MNKPIPVLEIFGPTVQGEGSVIGQKTMFVRTAGCDYSCSWCDSAFTWDGSAKDTIKRLLPNEILAHLTEQGGSRFSHVTISGGNPALHKSIGGLTALLKENGIQIALETQGTIFQEWFKDIDDLTLSPKPPSSGMTCDFTKLTAIFDSLKKMNHLQHVTLKVVVFTDEDLDFAKVVHKKYPDIPLFLQVGNDDVESQNIENLSQKLLGKYEELVEKVCADEELSDIRVLPQLHTLIWGNKRGV